MDTVKQLGELLLSSVPTIVLLLVVWIAYQNIVHRKLQKVLAERRALTEGAIQEAQAQISKSETRVAEYEQKLRDARSQVYKAQEARHRHIMEKRASALAEARRQADEMVKAAQLNLEKDRSEAQAKLQQQADALAQQIIDLILKPLAAAEGR